MAASSVLQAGRSVEMSRAAVRGTRGGVGAEALTKVVAAIERNADERQVGERSEGWGGEEIGREGGRERNGCSVLGGRGVCCLLVFNSVTSITSINGCSD